jgi:cytidine deaminase
VENASYGATICAERTAAVKAISEGSTSFTAIAIATDAKGYTPPCGICRQFLSEFAADEMDIYLIKGDDNVMITRLKELFPSGFTKEDLI